MSEEQTSTPTSAAESEEKSDARADLRAAFIVFCTAVAMAIHFVSGFTFDL